MGMEGLYYFAQSTIGLGPIHHSHLNLSFCYQFSEMRALSLLSYLTVAYENEALLLKLTFIFEVMRLPTTLNFPTTNGIVECRY